MGWSLNVGTIAGTTIRMHSTFLVLLVWIWPMHYQIGGTQAAWQAGVFVLAVFARVVLHKSLPASPPPASNPHQGENVDLDGDSFDHINRGLRHRYRAPSEEFDFALYYSVCRAREPRDFATSAPTYSSRVVSPRSKGSDMANPLSMLTAVIRA